MSGDGQAVIEQIYQMGVAPGTEAAAAGAWARAGAGGAVPSTIVATFNGIGFGGLQRPDEVVAEWASSGLPAVGEPVGVWEDEVAGHGLTATGATEVEDGLVTQAGVGSRAARITPTDRALTAVAGELLSERGGVVFVLELMDLGADGDVVSTRPALGGAGSDFLDVGLGEWAVLGVNKGQIGSSGVFFIQLDVTASQVAALFARGTPADPGGIGSAIQGTAPEFVNGIRFGNNLADCADFRLYGACVYHGDADVGATVLRYMQSRYIVNVAL